MISLSLLNFAAIRTLTRQRDAIENAPPPPPIDPTEGMTPQEVAIYELLNRTDFGCQNANVRELVGLIVGKPVPPKPAPPPPAPRRAFTIGTLVVYNEATMLVGDLDGDGDALIVFPDGSKRVNYDDGETRPYLTRNRDWRYATDAEIDDFSAAVAALTGSDA